jgi:hypothetical protein
MKWWDRSLRFIGKVLIVLVVGTFTVTVFFPGLFTKYLQSYANRKYLNPLGLRISYSGFVGDLFSAFQFRDITIAARNGTFTLKAEDARLNIDFLRFLRRDLSFDEVSIGHLRLDVQPGETASPMSKIEINRLPWISIQNLAVGEGTVTQGDEDYWFRITGNLDLTNLITLDDAQVEMYYPALVDTMHFAAKTLEFDGEHFTIVTGNLRYEDNYAVLDGEFGISPRVNMNLHVFSDQFKPPEFLPDWISWQSVEGDLLGNLDTLECKLALGMSALGEPLDKTVLDFKFMNGEFRISRAVFARGSQQITAAGNFDPSGNATLEVSFLNTTMDEFIPYATGLYVDGEATVNVQWYDEKIESLDIGLALSEIHHSGKKVRDVQGAVSMRNNIWSVTDTTALSFAGSNVQLWGSVDYTNELMDLEVYLQSDSLAELLDSLNWIPIQGEAEGQVWVSGPWSDPSLTGAVMLHNTGYRWLNIGQSFIQFILDSTLTTPRGRIYASMGKLDLGAKTLEGGEAEFFFEGDTIVTNTLRLYDGFEKLETKGYVILGDSAIFALDTLAVWRNTEILTGRKIHSALYGDGLHVSPTELNIAGGQIGISGKWKNADEFALLANGAGIDLERMLRFLGKPSRLKGIVNAETQISNRDGFLAISGQLDGLNGELDRIPFTELHSTFNLSENRLNLDEFTLRNQDGPIHAYGSLIYAVEESRFGRMGSLDSLDLRGSFDNYQFHDLQAHIPWRYATGGKLSGPFTARGPAKSPIYNAELSGTEPRFDKLTGNHIAGRLRYVDKRLEFIDLALDTDAGHYTGYGSIPADLSPASGVLDVIKDEPVDLHFSADISEMEFLTTYITDIDSLKGDFDVELSITGTFEKLIRDGNLSVKNGTVELFVMENPITGLKGEVVLENNIMSAVDLAGHTPRGQGRDKSNLSVTGAMDMSRFFQPAFDVQVTGEQVYFSLPLKDIEMVGIPMLSITGRDTILFSCQFEPDPGWPIFRMELAGPESYVLKEPDEGTIIVYNINVPFYSGAIVENSDVRNAEAEGEITLTRVGSEDWRYAGNIDVLSGEFVYNAYDFTIDEGWVILEPSEFNPRYYIRATTQFEYDIDPDTEETDYQLVDVTMILTGTMDDPQYAWEIPPNIPLTESDLVTLFALGQPLQEGIDPTITAGLSLTNIVLRRFEENARQAAGLDRLRIQSTSSRSIFPDPQEVRFHIGKRISPRLYIGVQADPTLSFNQYQIAYRLSRRTISLGTVDQSVVGSVDEDGLYQVKYRLKLRY